MFEHPDDLLADWPPPVPEAPAWLDDEGFGDLPEWTDSDALAEAVTRPAGVDQLANLLQVDPAALSADEAVTFAQQVDRVAAFVAGFQARARADVQARLVAHFETERAERAEQASGFVTAEMLASAELAAALRLSPRAMDVQFEHAADLAGPMRPLRDALEAGLVSAGHVSAIARELTRLPLAGDRDRVAEYAAQCSRILAVVIPYAESHTARQAAGKTKTLVLAVDSRGADERRRDAAEREHGVWLTPTENGSCEITAVLPLAHGFAVMDAITTLAKDQRFETADGCITAGQRKVAALVTMMLGDPGSVATLDGPVSEAKVRASVSVLVPLSTLTGTDPAAAGGSIGGEPVTADTLRDLLIDADPSSTLRKLVTDAAGCILDAGRARYAISDLQRRLISLRDGTCRFPGCMRPAENCEIDHATAYANGGRTDLDNLGPLCKHHHQLKTHGGWHITTSRRSGACTWRSPLGRIYHHEPPGRPAGLTAVTRAGGL
ncbi:MAG: DUF222 domain-containing protein [Actinomycetales bacterium]|nr:DUF222 domain-containing protein [Actinomycetales bacterium]